MSRCFPHPPPGYSRNGATYEALIESIKLCLSGDPIPIRLCRYTRLNQIAGLVSSFCSQQTEKRAHTHTIEARKLISENMVGSSSKSNMEDHIHGSKSLATPNRDYLSTGSWNIQDEIQRLRSKATEDMLSRHQSPKLDKILDVVKPVEPVFIVAPQPEDEIVNLASDEGTLGLSGP